VNAPSHVLIRAVALALAATLVAACSNGRAPSASPAASAPSGVAALADVLTYKGNMARHGTNPGPGPEQDPVVLWTVDSSSAIIASPLIADGLVIVAGQDAVVRALDPATGTAAWTLELPAGVVQTPTIANGTLFLITDDGVLRTFALDDRTAGWTAAGFVPDSIISVTDDLVIAGAVGAIVALSIADGKERWRATAPGSIRSAVDGDVVLVSGDGSGRVSAFDLATGSERWSFETSTADVLTPAIVDGSVFVAARNIANGRNIVYAIDSKGHELWHSTGPDILGSVSVVGDRVYVGVDDPNTVVKALDRSSGEVVWQRSLGGALVSLLSVADGVIYVLGLEEGLVAINADTGLIRWRADLSGAGGSRLTISGGLVFVTTRDVDGGGRVIAIADARDPRVAAAGGSSSPSASPSDAPVPLSILSVDPIQGQTLLLSTALAPDGTMYVGDMMNSRILVRHPDGVIQSWGEYGSGPGQFNFLEVTRNDGSVGVSVSPDGELIAVGDGGNHRVQLFNGSREFLLSIGRLGREEGQFLNPAGVTVDAEHRVWVVDVAREDVQVFSETGEHLLTFGGPGGGDGQLSRPSPAFVDVANDRVYVADFGNRRVAVFTTTGDWVGTIADGQLAPGVRLDEVNAAVLDRFGRLLIVDTTSRLFVVDASGELVGVLPNRLPDVGQVEFGSMVVDDQGRLYFADIGGTTAGRLIIAQLEPPLWPAE
jgi:outer membrane protein assembly factor BamB